MTDWFSLVERGATSDVRRALRRPEGLPHGLDRYGYGLLHYAALRSEGAAPIAAALLAAGLSPDTVDAARFRQTALHSAAEECRLDLADVLLAAGANPDVPDAWGAGPVSRALHAGGLDRNNERRSDFAELVVRLVAAGADLDRASAAGTTPAAWLVEPWWTPLRARLGR
jgi:ankyrin repeat protein